MARAITSINFGAWLIKCNPDIWDFASFVEDGNDWIGDWSITDNYRSRMMRANDRMLFWKSGDQPGYSRGIWGIGYVTDEARDTVAEANDDSGYWLDETARLQVTYTVPIDIPLFEEPVTDAELRAAGINDLEVQRIPGGSNPSWVTAEQLKRINALVGDWPDPSEPIEELTVTARGAGFGGLEQNRAVEEAAMAAVTASYREEGWRVKDVSGDKLGWDLDCKHRDGSTAKVEVKGVSGNRPIVLLTSNELRAASEEPDWALAVVMRALSAAPEILVFERDDALATAAPYLYRADLAHLDGTASRQADSDT